MPFSVWVIVSDKSVKMRLLVILLIILRSTVYGQVGGTSDSGQGRVSIQLKIDTANWQWEISITNKIPNSFIKLYVPVPHYWLSNFKLYDSSLTKITSRCLFFRPYLGKLYSRSQAKKIKMDTTALMTKIVDTKIISSANSYGLDQYFCRIKSSNLIGFSYSTPVIVYNKLSGNEMGRFNLSFSTAKMKVSQSKILADSASYPFVPQKLQDVDLEGVKNLSGRK